MFKNAQLTYSLSHGSHFMSEILEREFFLGFWFFLLRNAISEISDLTWYVESIDVSKLREEGGSR